MIRAQGSQQALNTVLSSAKFLTPPPTPGQFAIGDGALGSGVTRGSATTAAPPPVLSPSTGGRWHNNFFQRTPPARLPADTPETAPVHVSLADWKISSPNGEILIWVMRIRCGRSCFLHLTDYCCTLPLREMCCGFDAFGVFVWL